MGGWKVRPNASGKTLASRSSMLCCAAQSPQCSIRDSLRVLVAITLCLTQSERKLP